MSPIFKTATLALFCALNIQMAHADHLLACPPAGTLATYTHALSLPYEYNKPQKSVHFVSVALQPGDYAATGLIVYPVPVGFSEDPKVKTQELLTRLVLETPTPLNYRSFSNKTVPMCVYTLPGKNKFTAFLFSSEAEDTEGRDFSSKTSSKAMTSYEQAMKFLKFTSFAQ